MNPKAAALREAALAKEAGKQQSVPERSTTTRPRTHAAASSEGNNASKAAGAAAAAGTALAAATQVTNSPKTSARPDPPAARVERVDSDLPVTSPRKEPTSDRTQPALPATSNPSDIPEPTPTTQPRTKSPTHATVAGLSTSSPTIDHAETAPATRSSPLSPEDSKPSSGHECDSTSPARSARFSKWLSVAGTGDQIHEPPGRSVSPGKSALKSARGNSLSPERKAGIATSYVQAPSEISDGTSVASDEGSRLGGKKKQVKVSFDDEAEIVGVAASPPTSPEDYIPGSPPPGKAKSRMSWLGVGKKKQHSELITGDDDFDEVLKPRAALPSFGSVRGTRDGGPAPILDFSDNESSSSSDEEISAPPLSFSGDHAIGNVLPKVAESSQEALVDEDVKPVELPAVETPRPAVATPAPEPEPVAEAPKQELPAEPMDSLTTPFIAVEPATPPIGSDDMKPLGNQQINRSSMDQYQVPGGFPPPNSDRSLKSRTETPPPQPAGRISMDSVDTEAESESIYTDAPEDFDGDGFGSINAIVDGRSTPRSATPLGTENDACDRDVTPRPVEKTALATDQLEDPVVEDFIEQPGHENRAATPTQESVNRQLEAPIDFPSDQPASDAVQPRLPAKSKARAVQNGNIQMDKNSSVHDLRQPRDMSTLAAGQGKPRPVSLGAIGSAAQRAPIEPFPSSLRRKTSNGSDSSSSFKRAGRPTRSGTHTMRRTMRSSTSQGTSQLSTGRNESHEDYRPMSAGSAGPGTLRKTLRGPGAPSAQSDRYSFFSTNKKPVRTRSGRSPVKSASKFGEPRFIYSDGEDDAHQAQIFNSRFADSSDEEIDWNDQLRPVRGIPRRLDDGDSTDLEDSSEEERRQQTRNRAAAAAVSPKQQPSRTATQAKSTSPNMSGMAAVARQRGMTQRELEEFVMQPPGGRKPSFLSRIGLKKPKNSENRIRKADVESPSRRDTPLERSRLEREQLRENEEPYNPYASIVTSVYSTQPEPQASPKQGRKLSKRNTIAANTPWPLRQADRAETPEPIAERIQSAPSSPQAQTQPQKHEPPAENAESVAVNGGDEAVSKQLESPQVALARPNFNRYDSIKSDDSTYSRDIYGPGPARDVVIAGSGRKKRFPMLRKAFGLRS